MATEDLESTKTNALSDHGKTVLVLNIDIGQGHFEQLIVREEDEPIDLATAFSRKHGLGANITRALTEQIEHNIDELIREQCEQSSRQERRVSPPVYKPKPSVFDKLHQSSKRPRTAKPEPPKSTSPVKKPTGYTNLGHKLYYKGIRSKEQMDKKREDVKRNQEEVLNQSLKFKPTINKKSGKIAGRSPTHRPEEELLRKGKRTREMIEKKREQQEAAEAVAHSFVPGINLRERLEETFSQHQATECPFKPSIHTAREHSEEPIEVRLLKQKQLADEELERLRENMHQLKDEATGQAFFRPKTGRSPRKLARRKDTSFDSSSPRKGDLSASTEFKYTKGKSEQIVLKRKLDRLKEIFASLRPDDTGNITTQSIVIEDLDREILRIIAPILEEMEEQDQTLNFPEFADAMEGLLKTLTPDDRAIVMGFKKKVNVRETPRHAPEIKPYKFSKQYEERLSQPLYDRLVSAKKATEAKVKEEKDRKFQAEMAECSFHPKLQAHMPAPAVDQVANSE